MTKREGYIPKVKDIVATVGHDGLFEVVSIDTAKRSANIKGTQSAALIKDVPWTLLHRDKKTREDVNQAAARIVREATERD